MAQCAKDKRQNLGLDPQHPHQSPTLHHHLQRQCGGGGDRQIPEACEPTSVPNQQTPGSVGDPVVHRTVL